MNRKIAALLVAFSIVAGVGVGFVIQRMNDDDARADDGQDPGDSTSQTTDADQAVVERNRAEREGPSWSPADILGANGEPLELGHAVPGAFGVVEIGMTTDEAQATGFIVEDVDHGEICGEPDRPYWRWDAELNDGLDVFANDDGRISSLGDRKGGIETPEGITVGNSLGAIRQTYGDRVSEPEEAGYGQTGVFLEDDGRWLGFLFDTTPDQVSDSSRVMFMEVTAGTKPGLMRDGC